MARRTAIDIAKFRQYANDLRYLATRFRASPMLDDGWSSLAFLSAGTIQTSAEFWNGIHLEWWSRLPAFTDDCALFFDLLAEAADTIADTCEKTGRIPVGHIAAILDDVPTGVSAKEFERLQRETALDYRRPAPPYGGY